MILLVLGIDFDTTEAKELVQNSRAGIYYLNAKKNIADYFLNADAFCLSSKFEGLPITLLEAFACGCIPICTAVGGIKDIIQDGVNGFLDHEITNESYYKTVKRFMSQKEEIDKEKLVKYFIDNFSIKKCAAEHLAVYAKA